MKRIVITGGAGGVATALRPLLRQRYRLRLTDRLPITDATGGEEVAIADLGDLAALRQVFAGADGIVHLGAHALEADWQTIHDANIAGAYNVFEAARLEGVPRLVFASSHHTLGYFPRSTRIEGAVIERPDSRYAVSKLFGEALGSLYADRYGMAVLSIRIGHVLPEPIDKRRLAIWISPRDLAQLVGIGLEHPEVRNDIVYGISGNERAWWDNSNATRLGYRPQDYSEAFAGTVTAEDIHAIGDPRADANQGGDFCVAERL